MTKCLLLIITGMLLHLQSIAQLEEKGWWMRDLLQLYYLKLPASTSHTGFDEKQLNIFFRPEVGYALSDHWMIGLVPHIKFNRNTFEVPLNATGPLEDKSVEFGVGPLLRYYIPVGNRVSLMPEFYLFYGYTKYFKTYSTFGSLATTESDENAFGLGSNPSISCFVTRNLAVVLTPVQIGFFSYDSNRDVFAIDINPTSWIWGIEYHFNKNKDKTKK